MHAIRPTAGEDPGQSQATLTLFFQSNGHGQFLRKGALGRHFRNGSQNEKNSA